LNIRLHMIGLVGLFVWREFLAFFLLDSSQFETKRASVEGHISSS